MSFWLSPPENVSVSTGRKELGKSELNARRCAGEPIPQAAICLRAGLWHRAACHTFCPEDALCYLAANRHQRWVSGQVCFVFKLSYGYMVPFWLCVMGNRLYIFQLCEHDTEGSDLYNTNCRITSAFLLAALRHTLLQPMQRLCCPRSAWMPASRGSNGQAFLAAPVMLSLPSTYCNIAPSRQHR